MNKIKRLDELSIATNKIAFQNEEKEKRAAELLIADKELHFQNKEKENRAAELIIANKELLFQNKEKEKRAAELIIANKELLFQNKEKEKRAAELIVANKELAFQNKEKENRAAELIIANQELAFQNKEKENRAAELIIANQELAFQNREKENRAAELIIANQELAFQNREKENRAAELIIANKELAFQNREKENRAAELIIANHELAFQNKEKENRAAELIIINKKLSWQNEYLEKRVLSNGTIQSFRQNLKRPAFRELMIIVLMIIILIALGLTVNWTEGFVSFLYHRLDTPLDDIFVSFGAISLFLIIYTIRRNNEQAKLIRIKAHTEAALKESEIQLTELVGFNQKLIDVSPMGIGSYDMVTGKCLSANVALAKILGGSHEEVLKQNFKELNSWKETSLLSDAEDTLLNGKIHHNEILITTSFNTKVWIDYRFVKFLNKHQPHLLLMVNDISVRKRAEQSLRSSQCNLKAIIENSDGTIYSLDRNFRYITFNQSLQNSMKQIYGLDVKPGDNVYDFLEKLNPGEARDWQAIYSKALKGETIKFEKEFNFNNIYSCISFSIHPIWENQEVIGLSCFTIDTTKQKQTSNALAESEFRFRQIVETAQEGIWLTDENNRTTFVNKKMCEILEYSEEEMRGKEDFYFMDDAGKKGAPALMEKRKNGILENIDLGFITKSGKSICTKVSANPVLDDKGRYNGALGMVTDITEKKNLENLLNKANSLARIGNWEVDLVNNTLYWSDITRQIHEVPGDFIPELTTALNFYKSGTSRDTISHAVKEAIENCTSFDLELQIVTAKGNVQWVRSIGEVECINNKCVRLAGSFQDINSKKIAELEILKVYEEKNIILESIGDAFFAVDKSWGVTYWNNQAEKLLHTSKNKILGKHLWEVFSNSIDSKSYRKYHQAIETNQVIHFEDNYVPLGKWYWISAYPSKNGLSVFFKDITEQKKSEEEKLTMTADIIQRNKDLEQFSYIISHNLRAPIANIIGLSYALQKDDLRNDLKKPIMDGLFFSANKLDEVIKDLNNILNVRQGVDENKKIINFTKLVKNIESGFESMIVKEQAVIKCDFTAVDEMFTIKKYLHCIFYNLISNSLKYRQPDLPPVIEIKSQKLNDTIILFFKDNGLGIDLQKRGDQVFGLYKRFHTNRAEGKGMGLYLVKTQVESMGGKITIASKVNKGTEFKIEFNTKQP